MLPFAYFGINSSGVNLAINLLILFLVVVWLALVYWTYSDARRRIADPMLIACATAAALFPFVGTIVYMIVRPPEYLDDVRERELEMQAAEARLHDLNYSLCPHCDYEVERDFLICPSCLHRLKDPCANCGRPLDQSWTVCPFCETQVPGAVPPRRRRRRETSESAALVEAAPAGHDPSAESAPRSSSGASARRSTGAGSAPRPAEASSAQHPAEAGTTPRSAAARSAARESKRASSGKSTRRPKRNASGAPDAGSQDTQPAPVTPPTRVTDTPHET